MKSKGRASPCLDRSGRSWWSSLSILADTSALVLAACLQPQGFCLSACAPSPALQLSSKQQPPPNPIELRWSYLNVEGVWPEVLRRYIMLRAGPSAPRLLVFEAVQDACQQLGQQSVTSLSANEHLALLR